MTEIDFSKGIVMPNFSNYVVFPEEGKVWSYKTKRFIGSPVKSTGYWRVALTDDDGKAWKVQLHRVIWMSVHGEIPEGMEVNHTTEDKNQNGIQFLELVTHKENCNFGTRNTRIAEKSRGRQNPKITEKLTNRQDQSKKVAVYRDGVLVMTFPSTAEAGRCGFTSAAVSACCRNCYFREGNNIYKGYTWIYFEEFPPLFI